MSICCAIGSPDSCPALLLLAGHSTCVLRWVGRGTRRSDRLPSPVLASLLPRTPHRSLSCSYSYKPNVSFFFRSSNNLRCWMATCQPTSCQAKHPHQSKAPLPTWRDLGLPQYLWRAASNFLIWCIVSMHCILCSIKDGCFARQYWRGGVENDLKYVTASFTLMEYFTESMSFAEKWCCPQLTDAWVVSSSPPSLF